MHVHCPRDVPDLAAGPESAPVGTSARHILDIATGSRAYILGMTALHILDVSNPRTPVEAMALPLPAQYVSFDGGHRSSQLLLSPGRVSSGDALLDTTGAWVEDAALASLPRVEPSATAPAHHGAPDNETTFRTFRPWLSRLLHL
jgi:hypothetical protein